MDGRRAVKIDLDELCSAMDDSFYEHDYYLDLETGEILFISDYMHDEGGDNLKDRVSEDSERYEQIPKAKSYEGYEDMADFIATVEDERLAELLEVAINGKGAFHRFKDVLARYLDKRKRWYRFQDDKIRERALEWLESIGISPYEE